MEYIDAYDQIKKVYDNQLKEIADLKDQLHRRNALIKKLRESLKECRENLQVMTQLKSNR